MARDMTSGSITKHVIIYTIPLLFGNILQQMYNTVDSIVVGQFNGKEALASIGAAGPIMNILIFLIVGISMGSSILMAGFFGAKEFDLLKKEMSTSLIFGLIFTMIVSFFSFLGTELLLKLTRTPVEILSISSSYLKIIIFGLPFSFIYNIFSAGLRSIGNSRTPLIVLMLSSVINIFLDIYFVGILKNGIYGAAYATVISQFISGMSILIYTYFRAEILRVDIKNFSADFSLLKKTVNFSSVSAVQQTVVYTGKVLVQAAVNMLGVDAVAAFNSASIIDNYVICPGDSIAASLTTFVAQNKGAGKNERIPKGLKVVIIIGVIYCLIISVAVIFTAEPLIKMFLKENELNAISLGINYLHVMSFFYICVAFCQSFQGFFRGIGNLWVTLVATLIQIPIRVIVSYSFINHFGITAVCFGVALGWICMIIYELNEYRKYKIKFLK